MASVNEKASNVVHPKVPTSYDLLRRSVMSCLLWEDTFYEDGVSVTERIKGYMNDVSKEEAISVLEEAKFSNRLRHIPLYLSLLMAQRGFLTSTELEKIITRVDDMSELLALYEKIEGNKKMIPHSIQKGLSKAFTKFDEYQFGKYKGLKKDKKLRDVLRVARPKPINEEQSLLWKKILDNSLAIPDTWEVELSASEDKKESWTRLLSEKTDKGHSKLPSLALLRNLRNIIESGVDSDLIRKAIREMNVSLLLPFQFLTASKYAPSFSDEIEKKFFECISYMDKMKGSTIILLDSSGSMTDKISENSKTTRGDIAVSLGAIARELCEESYIYTFNMSATLVPSHLRGFSLSSVYKAEKGTAVCRSTNYAVKQYRKSHSGRYPTRVIVITDEQTNYDRYYHGKCQNLENLPQCTKGYMVNIGTYEKGIEYNKNSGWETISGWSENILKYIQTKENEEN